MAEAIVAEGQGQDQGPNVAGDGKQPEEGSRTFTQAELDRIIADRLARQKAQFGDYEDLKTAKTELDALKAEQLTELEKAQTAAADAAAKLEAAVQQSNERLIQGAFIAEAAKLGVSYPEDAYSLADRAGVSITDDGKVTGVELAVKALVDAGRLVMAGKPKAAALDAGAGGGERGTDAPPALTEEELLFARKMNLTPEEYQKGKR